MKKVLSIIAALGISGAALSCYAEGTLGLENFSSNPVFYLTAGSMAPATPEFWVQVDANGTPLTQPFNLIVDGYFDNGLGYVAGTLDGADVSVTMAAWKGATGDRATAAESHTATWSQASGKNPGAPSPPVPVALAVPGDFIIQPAIPEPSTVALVLLGGAALLLRRRQ